MRFRTAACIPTAALALVGGALLTACNDDSDSSAKATDTATSAPSSAAAPVTTAPTSAAPTDSAPAAGSSSATDVNKSFTDDVMGDKATVIKYINGYQPSAAAKSKYSALADENVVLVDVKVTASSKYYDSFGADSFYLTGTPNGIDDASTTILDDEIKAAGYPPLQDAETGKTTTGWVVFTPSKDTTHLVLRYKRLAATASDGTNITAKNYDTPLN